MATDDKIMKIPFWYRVFYALHFVYQSQRVKTDRYRKKRLWERGKLVCSFVVCVCSFRYRWSSLKFFYKMDFKFQRENLSCFFFTIERETFSAKSLFPYLLLLVPFNFETFIPFSNCQTIKFFFFVLSFYSMHDFTLLLHLCLIALWAPHTLAFQTDSFAAFWKVCKKSDKCTYTEKESEMVTERSKHQRRTKTDEKEFLPFNKRPSFYFQLFLFRQKISCWKEDTDESDK